MSVLKRTIKDYFEGVFVFGMLAAFLVIFAVVAFGILALPFIVLGYFTSKQFAFDMFNYVMILPLIWWFVIEPFINLYKKNRKSDE